LLRRPGQPRRAVTIITVRGRNVFQFWEIGRRLAMKMGSGQAIRKFILKLAALARGFSFPKRSCYPDRRYASVFHRSRAWPAGLRCVSL